MPLQAIWVKGQGLKAGRRNASMHKQQTGQITRPLSQMMGLQRATRAAQRRAFHGVEQLGVMPRCIASLHRDALGQVAGLIHIKTAPGSDVIAEQLHRHQGEQRREQLIHGWYRQ